MALVPARDHLGEFLLLLESANGRDKVCRIIQYSAKAMKWRAEENKAPEDQIKVTNGTQRSDSCRCDSMLIASVFVIYPRVGVE